MISAEGIVPDPSKIEAVRNLAPPRDPCSVRSLLGMTSYYCKFIKNYAALSDRLTSLLKLAVRDWSDREQTAFEQLKGALVSFPILSHLKENAELLLNRDASFNGFGAVLVQRVGGTETVVCYLSRRLTVLLTL